MQPIPAKVFVLTTDNDSGLSSSVHLTRAGAEAALFRYVETNWHHVMNADVTIPEDSAAAIEAYFAEDGNDDRAEIEECEVEGRS